MARIAILCLMITCMLCSRGDAKPKVICNVQLASKHASVVTLAWEVKAESDRAWDVCDLHISFEDEKGREIHFATERLELKVGHNVFSGYDICDAETWKRINKYVATLDCVF